MKKHCLFFFLLFPLFLKAEQVSDSIKDWKWAAGVSLWNNVTYNDGMHPQKKLSVFEWNINYHLKENHSVNFRMLLYPKKTIPISDAPYYTKHARVYSKDANKFLYGAAVGYQYDFSIKLKNVSPYVGIDFLYYHLGRNDSFYQIRLGESEEVFNIQSYDSYDLLFRMDCLSIPIYSGIRYRISQWMMEGFVSVRKNFFNQISKQNIESISDHDEISRSSIYSPASGTSGTFVYGLRLYYLF